MRSECFYTPSLHTHTHQEYNATVSFCWLKEWHKDPSSSCVRQWNVRWTWRGEERDESYVTTEKRRSGSIYVVVRAIIIFRRKGLSSSNLDRVHAPNTRLYNIRNSKTKNTIYSLTRYTRNSIPFFGKSNIIAVPCHNLLCMDRYHLCSSIHQNNGTFSLSA
jgi:hypothetical protein